MKLTYFGQSCLLIDTGDTKLLFDPFISGNPIADHIDIDAIRTDYILLTHGHGDHVLDTERIAAHNPDAVLISNFEIVSHYEKKGLKGHPMNLGGWWNFDFGKVRMVNAIHSSVLPDGTYAGNPGGFVIEAGGKVFYIAGDTALTKDMELIPILCPPLDFAVLPIGGNFTMDYHDANLACEMIQCHKVIGCHYDTFGYIKIDKTKAIDIFYSHKRELLLPAIGETIEL